MPKTLRKDSALDTVFSLFQFTIPSQSYNFDNGCNMFIIPNGGTFNNTPAPVNKPPPLIQSYARFPSEVNFPFGVT